MDASGPAGNASDTGDPRTVLVVGGALVIVVGLAWAWTIALAAMPDCHRLAFGAFVGMWTVMMAAMMFPAIVPVVLAVATFARGRAATPLGAALAFVVGYLVVWGALALPARALLDAGDWLVRAAPWTARAGGVVLVACGLYQLTPLKDACLRHCRTPDIFLGHHWRDRALRDGCSGDEEKEDDDGTRNAWGEGEPRDEESAGTHPRLAAHARLRRNLQLRL